MFLEGVLNPDVEKLWELQTVLTQLGDREKQLTSKPESFAAIDQDLHFDLSDVSRIALKVGSAHQGSIDARRRNFQPIRTFDGIGDIEDRR